MKYSDAKNYARLIKRPARYIRITLRGGGSYIQPRSDLMDAINAELDDLEDNDEIVLHFQAVEMTDEEYEKLPEFWGH